MEEKSTTEQKDVEFYSAAVTAWFTTSLEYDKSLLALSAAGIGLHLTLLTTVGLKSAEGLVLYISSIICFTAALLATLRVFSLNKKHIEEIISGRITGNDPELAKLDLFAIVIFGIGVVLTAIVGISAAVYSYSEKESSMTNNANPTKSVPTFDSVNGAAKLQPSAQLEKSFNGAASLQPSTSIPAAQTATSQAPAPAPAPAPTTQTASHSQPAADSK